MKEKSNIFGLNKVDGAGPLEDSSIESSQGISLGTRAYNRCVRCGRPHSYLRKYKICRICFRELLNAGEDPKRWAENHKNEWKRF